MKSVLVLVLSLIGAGRVCAQVTQAWVARYDGAYSEDRANALALDSSGNVYVTGESNDYLVGTGLDFATVKYDSAGNQLWVAIYDGPDSLADVANAMALDAAGNAYVTGSSRSVDTQDDYATVKYDPDGNQLWVARYDGPMHRSDSANAIALDAAGNVYVTGNSRGVGTQDDYATVKYDSDGNQLWVARYDGPAHLDDHANAIALDGAGNAYVTGFSMGVGTQFDYATVKYDPDGNQLWVARYNGPVDGSDLATAIALDAAGNVHVTGYSFGGATSFDYATVKYDSAGNQLWVARYNGPGNGDDYAYAVALDASGNVHVTGSSFISVIMGTQVFGYGTVKYDSDGNQLWVALHTGPNPGHDVAYAMALDSAGNVYVTGESYGELATNYDYGTVKYDPSGNQQWDARYTGIGVGGPDDGEDAAKAIAVDAAGNVYVTGASNGDLYTLMDYATVMYSQQ